MCDGRAMMVHLDRLRAVVRAAASLTHRLPLVSLLLAVLLLLPPLRAFGEATMVRQMLVQMPLIVLAGWCAGRAWVRAPEGSRAARLRSFADSFNRAGATGIVIASFTMILWMLPRSLDAARLSFGIDALKFASLAFGLGLPVAWSWVRCPPIARAVIHVEVIATLARFGWGYAAADERLCASYLQGDQERAGMLLVAAALAWAVVVAWRPLFGGLGGGKPAAKADRRDGAIA